MTAALDAHASRAAFGAAPPPADDESVRLRLAWNLMGGTIDWAALPVVVDLLGEDDPETLIRGLIMVRDALSESHAAPVR